MGRESRSANLRLSHVCGRTGKSACVVTDDGTACLANVRPMDASDREDNPYKHGIQEVGGMDGKRLRLLVVRD